MTVGPGTELKRLLGRLGIHSSYIPACKCDQRAMVMDEQGPQWCRENLSTIIEWMKEESEARGLLFVRILAKLLVLRAIRNAEKKLEVLN